MFSLAKKNLTFPKYELKENQCFDVEWVNTKSSLAVKYESLLPLSAQKVACGLFGISDDYIEKYISLDDKLIKDRASTFLFRASGTSMEPTVFKNDILVVDRSLQPLSNQVVVFSFNGDMLCKRIIFGSEGKTFISDNKSFEPLVPTHETQVILFGVVTAVITENP